MILLFSLLVILIPSGQSKSTPYLLTRYMAKEYCSCRFVVKQSHKVCKNENKTLKVLWKIETNEETKEVIVKNLVHKAKAHFIDDRYGCVLDN